MTSSPPPLPHQRFRWGRAFLSLLVLGFVLVVFSIVISGSLENHELASLPTQQLSDDWKREIERVDSEFETAWENAGVHPAPEADDLTLIRRLSLSLTGAPPSLEEIQQFQKLPESADSVQSWLDHLFEDPRYHQYFAERLARAYVGVEPGPFLVFRRRRLVNWLAQELAANRPYDELVRSLIAAEGLWTTHPEANFVTVAVQNGNGENRPDPIKLAARTSRAFLGVSLDCMQCHDDKFGDHWKQEHFHELAAFYAQTEMGLTGLREKRTREYEIELLGDREPTTLAAVAPFQPELLPESGSRRERLAQWITHEDNEAFARATVNRVWGLLLGRPLTTPVDDISIEGPFPTGMEKMANLFRRNNHDLQGLIRLIAGTSAFRRASASGLPESPVTQAQEETWAAFPITPLRSEQVAGAVIQASSLQAIDHSSHIIHRIRRANETQEFVKRYGDQGEAEFLETAGTIPQRLLLMNGKFVSERTQPNPFMNSSTRLANYAPGNDEAVEAAFLATLTRLPTPEEKEHFVALLGEAAGEARQRAMEDVLWALINSTEFSWNR